MDVSKYRQLFLDECREHLQGLNRELLRLEREQESYQGVDTLFREAHSIKGMSGSMNYEPMVSLSHAMEDVLDGIRKKSVQAQPELMSLLYKCVDTLENLTDEVEEKGEPTLEVQDLVARLRSLAGVAPPASEESQPAPVTSEPDTLTEAELPEVDLDEFEAERPGATERIPEAVVVEEEAAPESFVAARGAIFQLKPEKLEMVRECSEKGLTPYACQVRIARDTPALAARNFVVLGRLSQKGVLIQSVPTLEEVRAGDSREVVEALLMTEGLEKDLQGQILSIPEVQEIQIRNVKFDGGDTEGSTAAEGTTAWTESSIRVSREATVEKTATAGQIMERYLPRKSTTVRVDTRILDDLINIVGELIINRGRLQEIGRGLENEPLQQALGRLRVLVREFQDTIMAVRMMPLELLTDRLPRIVRDIAHQGGKEVSFEILSKGIELDRAILEEMNDVLIHIVRNAIDHGVEAVEERRAAGKPVRASIRLRAGRERDWVWVMVEDDGRGMNPEKIRQVALERGLITPEKAAAMAYRDLLLLSCLAGLSTSSEVSDVSGRGVGMDVVKAKVESFGGTVLIDSKPGRGTQITLRLPLTLAIIQILLVDVRGQEFGLPVSHIAHTTELKPNAVQWSQKKPVMKWGKRIVPLLDLGQVLGLPARDLEREESFQVALAEFGGRLAALAVDRLVGTYETVIKPLGPPLKKVRGLAGVTIMGDSRTILVLDISTLV
jgi:two-component system chemotaxis sensor kinase CheA